MRRETLRGFHGARPRSGTITSILVPLVTWSHPTARQEWECSLAGCQGGRGNELGGYREGSARGPQGDA